MIYKLNPNAENLNDTDESFIWLMTTDDPDMLHLLQQLLLDGWLRMGLLPPREFCRHILSCRKFKAESFKRCLHSVLRGVSL